MPDPKAKELMEKQRVASQNMLKYAKYGQADGIGILGELISCHYFTTNT